MKNVFIDNDGDAIDLNSIASISRILEDGDNYLIEIKYVCGDTACLSFKFDDYASSSKEVLLNKINKIRMDIIKKWNNDQDPTVFFNKINLTKKTDVENDTNTETEK